MEFDKVQDDGEYMFFKHASKEGVEIFIYPVMFGYRIRTSIAGSHWCETDYCAGREQKNVELLFSVIYNIVSKMTYDEYVSFKWPWQERKPVFNDIKCFLELLTLSGEFEIIEVPDVNEFRKKLFEKAFNNG